MGILHKKNADGIKEPTAFYNALSNTLATTSKQLIWVYSINGIAWIWCSYILAFLDKTQIAETLSENVCKVIIGQIGFYLVTKMVENVFKYNDHLFKHLRDKKDKKEDDNIEEVIDNVEFTIPEPEPVPDIEPVG